MKWIFKKKFQIPSINLLPCLLITEFFQYSFSQIDTQTIDSFFGQILMRWSTKNFNVWHSYGILFLIIIWIRWLIFLLIRWPFVVVEVVVNRTNGWKLLFNNIWYDWTNFLTQIVGRKNQKNEQNTHTHTRCYTTQNHNQH